jgi:hypothetical protein
MLRDRYGLPASTVSRVALEAYVDGVDRLLSASVGADERFERALAADPGFALAHIGRARSLQIQARIPEARSAAARARELAAPLGRRERDHVEALAIGIDGDGAEALAAIRAHLAGFPRDAMVLGPATGVYGLIGFSGRPDRNEQLADLLDGLASSYGDDWWFLGAHGFALTEARGWAAGAPLIERALELNPRNAHAAHAHAHVLYEGGGDAEGAAFLDSWLPGYPRQAQLHCHVSWHLALFELALGQRARAWDRYMDGIRPGAALSPPMPTLADSASFVWRMELAGEARRAERWKDVAAHAEGAFPRIGLAFADAHCALAAAASGDTEALERRIAELRRADADGRLPAGSAVPIVAEAFGAFARGDLETAIARLAPVVDQLVRIGGSRAQRDLFENTLLAALVRSGRTAEAAALLSRRIDRQPTVPIAREA